MTTKTIGRRPGPCPHLWKSGPDPETHARYLAWLQQRNQAQFRGETWNLDFETFRSMWDGCWHLRGRTRNSMCMMRVDPELPWDSNNTVIVPRMTQLTHQQRLRRKTAV